jgi:tau tubulin kinase
MNNPVKRKPILPVSSVVKAKWKIQGKIGQGAFGEAYAAVDLYTNEDVAIKVEKLDNKKMVLKLEVIALKKIQSCPYVVRYIDSGRKDDCNFLVMERLGENLAELRKHAPRQCFSMSTSLRLGIQMIEALEGVHKIGYIHRDVKPSNFVMGKTKTKRDRAYLIDFGLARKFKLPNGDIRPPRKTAGFRGTARYASVNSHKLKELGRRDDIWSVFYLLIEFLQGSLPWKKIKDKDHIGELKEKLTNTDLVKDLPSEFVLFMEHLEKLGYADEPDYDYLKTLLKQIYEREGYAPEEEWDWNLNDKNQVPITREIQSIMDEPVVSSNPTRTAPSSSKVNTSTPQSGHHRNTQNNQHEQGEFYSIYHSNGNSKGPQRRLTPTNSSPNAPKFIIPNQKEAGDEKGCRCSIM